MHNNNSAQNDDKMERIATRRYVPPASQSHNVGLKSILCVLRNIRFSEFKKVTRALNSVRTMRP